MPLRYCILTLFVILTLHAQSGRGGAGRGGPMQAGQGAAPPPPSDCAASGTVVNSVSGAPIPRAMVSMGGADAAGSATDATGHWSIANTVCGTRFANATHPGFVSANRIAGGPAIQRIQLVSGSPVTNVKISLMPEASIAGTVRDSDGDPLDAVQVRAMRVMVRAGQRVLANNGGASVDSQGNFRIDRLVPGRYIVCATSGEVAYPVGGGEPLVYQESCFPGPAVSGTSAAMPVEAGSEARASFTLTAARGVHVRGSVSGGPPTPAEGPPAQVQLIANQQNMGRGNFARVMPDGTFDIPSVSPGSYVARVNFRSNQPNTAVPSAAADVDVGDSDVNNVQLAARSPGSLSGTVRFELTAPASSDNSATPPPNPVVNVNLRPPALGVGLGAVFNGPIPQPKWDADHLNFEFAGVPFGQFLLNANLNGPNGATGAYIKSVTLRGQDAMNQPISVDGLTGPVEIVVSNDVGAIDATVNDAAGNPGPGSVMLVSTTGRRVMLNAGDDGHATLNSVPTGEYKAWAFDNINNVPYAEDQWMNQNAGPGEKVVIASTGSANVTLKRIAAPAE